MRYSLRTKLIGSFAIVLLLTLVVGLVGIYFSKNVQNRQEELVEKDVEAMKLLSDVSRMVSYIRSNSQLHLISKSVADMKRYESEIADWQSKAEKDLNNLENITKNGATIGKLTEFRSAWETYLKIWETQVMPLSRANRDEEAFALARKRGVGGRAAIEVMEKLNELHGAIVSKAAHRIELAEQDFRKSQRISIGVILAAIILGLAFAIKQSSNIAGAVNAVSKTAKLVAAGDLEQSVNVRTGDEIESMADSFNIMISNMKKMVEELRHEITERYKAENALQEIKGNLEVTVEKRTYELRMTNEQLGQEITERKRSEELFHENRARLDLALRSASMGVWHWDIIENKRYFDDQSCHLLGINPATFTGSAEEFFRVLHPDDRETIKAALARTIEQDVLYEPEYRAVWPDGSVHYITARGRLVCDNKGRPLRINGILWDITERKKAEETIKEYAETLEEKIKERTGELQNANLELQALNKELELRKQEADEANKAKSDFLANMSHELRTPLNAIIGFSDMMFHGMSGKLTEQQLEYLGDIRESGELLLSLINDILDLSKVEAGKMELELSEFNVKDLIERNMILFKEKAMKHRIKLTAEVPLDVELIEADERKIKQVIANLLSNAMKFTPDGGSVSVQARLLEVEKMRSYEDLKMQDTQLLNFLTSQPPDRNFIEISVEDTGIGIRPEDFDKIFQPFQQLEYILNKKYEGTGLGLTLCERIVELHHGRIWVESEMGKGTKFTFVIPIRQ